MSTVDFDVVRGPRRFRARGDAGRRPRRRPRRPDRRLPARQAGPARDRVRGRGPGRRPRQDRGARRLPLRSRRPSLLHQVQGGRRPLARGDEGGVPQAPAHVAHLLERQVPRLPARRHGRRSRSSARSSSIRSGLSYLWAADEAQGQARRTSSSGSPTASASGSTSTSSSPTPRRCGASRPPSCAPSGPPSGSRACPSSSAAKAAFFGNKGNKIKSLISEFHYPRFGPGQMWETMADEIIAAGGEVRLNSPVDEARGPRRQDRRDRGRRRAHRALAGHLLAAAARDRRPGRRRRHRRGPGRRPGPALPRLPDRRAGDRRRGPVPGQLDLHPRARACSVGRIQNYRSWSPWMVPDESKACVGLEYFCFQGDELWEIDDDDARRARQARARRSSAWPRPEKVERGFVTRVPLAYPMYDADYGERVDVDPRLARGRSPTCSRSGATACTATTTPTTRC